MLWCTKVNDMTLYPWIHQFSNNKQSADQTRPVHFPDVNPQSLPHNPEFTMVAGDFLEIYTKPGPLLYHFENMANELSIELSYEDIKAVILKYGFQIEVERDSVQTTYTENDHSMLKYLYDCVFFVVRKPVKQLLPSGFPSENSRQKQES
ncbi:UNVERIFIED_CONTAM: hypothetical protein FKN15_008786 [Acipenser sinensis]